MRVGSSKMAIFTSIIYYIFRTWPQLLYFSKSLGGFSATSKWMTLNDHGGHFATRKLCYRKDDRAMRPMGALKIFWTP